VLRQRPLSILWLGGVYFSDLRRGFYVFSVSKRDPPPSPLRPSRRCRESEGEEANALSPSLVVIFSPPAHLVSPRLRTLDVCRRGGSLFFPSPPYQGTAPFFFFPLQLGVEPDRLYAVFRSPSFFFLQQTSVGGSFFLSTILAPVSGTSSCWSDRPSALRKWETASPFFGVFDMNSDVLFPVQDQDM